MFSVYLMASLALLPSRGTAQSVFTTWNSKRYSLWFLGFLIFTLDFPSGLSLLLLYITSTLCVLQFSVWIQQVHWDDIATGTTVYLQSDHIVAQKHVSFIFGLVLLYL